AHAYRVFYRQVGLDPDVTRVPSEEAAVGRLLHGGFRSENRIADARLVALVETGVPVWALDAGCVEASTLGVRTSGEDERVDEVPVASGRLVIADAQTVHAVLFGRIADASAPRSGTREVLLFSVGVDGVPSIYL